MSDIISNSGHYKELLSEILVEIRNARIKAAKALHHVNNGLYWEIGRLIVERQKQHAWGKSVVEKLSLDLQHELQDTVSWSPRNLWFMRQFFEEYAPYILTTDNQENKILKQPASELQVVKQLASQLPNLKQLLFEIPWWHNILILQKVKDIYGRIYYLKASAVNGWSRAILLNQIKANAYEYYVQNPKQHNFEMALPEFLHEQAIESLKSVYTLDFLGITQPVHERQLSKMLVENVKRFIMELGYGFCFIGNEYRLTLGEKEYFVDLLFYHRILKCMVAIELKVVEFEPEFIGKLDYYLELIDEQLKQPDDNPSIGILLCPQKNHLEVEYALRVATKPIGVAEYKLTKELPEAFKGKLPSAEDLNRVIELTFSSLKKDSSNKNEEN